MTETELTVLGRTLRGRVDDPVVDHLRTRWVDALAPVVLPAEPVVLELRTRPGVPNGDGGSIAGGGLVYRRAGADAFAVQEADPTAGAVLVELTPHGARLELAGQPFAAFLALDAALAEALASTGIMRLHASVVTRATTTLALLGPSGRGKSTTALRAALAGWQIATDDDCFVDAASLVVHGAGTEVRLRPDACDRLGRVLDWDAVDPPVDGRHLVPFATVGGRTDTAVLTHLVHLSPTRGAEPGWTPMTRAEGVMALHESCGIPLTDRVARIHARWFPEVVGRTRRLRLDPGPAASPFPELPD